MAEDQPVSPRAFEALRSTSLFAGFTDEQLEMVPKVGRTRTFAEGECVVAAGPEVNPGLWLVLEGTARVEVEGEFLRTIGPSGHFGEMALLSGEPRSADVFAHTDLVAMELTDRHLRGLIGRDPEVALAMLAELARRLRALTEDFAALRRQAPAVGVAGDVDEGIDPGAVLGPIEYALGRPAPGDS